VKMTMRVNGASIHPMTVDVEYRGAAARAQISMLEIEMHDEGRAHGSWTLRVDAPGDFAALKEKFKPGSTVTIDTDAFEVVPPEPVEMAPAEEPAPAQ